mmetsp:Transcript_28768/g.81143  ORF Transcript_28768/g.81143 Transcript_28768/m.81143 type:complete len:216 (+) Transcript_28768:1011-1658(+)
MWPRSWSVPMRILLWLTMLLPPTEASSSCSRSPSRMGMICRSVALSRTLGRRLLPSMRDASLRGMDVQLSLRKPCNRRLPLEPSPPSSLVCSPFSCHTELPSSSPRSDVPPFLALSFVFATMPLEDGAIPASPLLSSSSFPSSSMILPSPSSSNKSNCLCMYSATSKLVPMLRSPRDAKKYIMTGQRSLVLKTRVSLWNAAIARRHVSVDPHSGT